MQVRNALADAVIDCDKSSVGSKSGLECLTERLRSREERPDFVRGEVSKGFTVRARHKKDVSREKRAGVEKCDARLVRKHDVSGHVPGNYRAEGASLAACRRARHGPR